MTTATPGETAEATAEPMKTEARTCPDCGMYLCHWCATAWGQTAVHVNPPPDGKCANGHTEMWWRP